MEDKCNKINPETGEIERNARGTAIKEIKYPNTDDGREDFKFDKGIMRKRIQAYKDALKPCIVTLLQHITDSLLRVMRMDKVKYQRAYDDNDLVGIYAMARFASTGQGADSIYSDLVRMSVIKVENGDWMRFVSLFQELRKRILGSNIRKEDIIEKFFDALFIIRSGEGVKDLEKLVSEIMCERD